MSDATDWSEVARESSARRRRRIRVAVVATVIVLGAIGGGVYAWWSYEHDVPGLDSARSRWHAVEWHDYSFEFSNGCFCQQIDVVVTVRGSRVTSVVPVRRPMPGTDSYWRSQAAHPIDWFFDRISAVVPDADSYSVNFDPDTGAPSDFSVDPSKNVMDDEWGWTITNVKRIR